MQPIETVGKLADENNIEWALAGGLAVILYGNDRMTKDIDFIASKKLPLKSEGNLVQGGEGHLIKTNRKEVAVDWIICKDEFKQLFAQALSEAVKINGVPVLTPEWVVILKFIAGRFKDVAETELLDF